MERSRTEKTEETKGAKQKSSMADNINIVALLFGGSINDVFGYCQAHVQGVAQEMEVN